MTPHKSDLSLIADCDEAANLGFLRCDWCDAHGHAWRECEEYEAYVRRIGRADRARFYFWKVLIVLSGGVLAGFGLRMLMEVM